MNENHQRRLLTTLQQVDNLLSDVERIMAAPRGASLFQTHAQDATPAQRQTTQDFIGRVRATMRRILGDLNIPLQSPISGALWAARTRVSSAIIALGNIEPKQMLAYGDLSAEDARRVDQIIAELNSELTRVADYLTNASADPPPH
ncbi:MAG TPA: hypothetical protein VEP50_06315 [bacterium]|nr:hypothetical protein [bacterium]